MKRLIILALALTIATTSANAQTDPRLKSAVQLAAEGLPDSAAAIVNGLLAVTPVSDPFYPEILYTQGSIARTTTEMQRAYQKLAVEYPTSDWADDALLAPGPDGFRRAQLRRYGARHRADSRQRPLE